MTVYQFANNAPYSQRSELCRAANSWPFPDLLRAAFCWAIGPFRHKRGAGDGGGDRSADRQKSAHWGFTKLR